MINQDNKLDFTGLTVLITAGPTQEPIDPVRYISNRSSGKMGYALASVFAEAGADVVLVSGPVALTMQHESVTVVPVMTAQEMYEVSSRYFGKAQLVIWAAAVADYTPKTVATGKLKKKTTDFMLELVKTVDIAATLGAQKRSDQFIVGFALETDHEKEHALAKLTGKHLDLIVLNSMRHENATFGFDTNQITLFDRQGEEIAFPLKPKNEVARDIASAIYERFIVA